MNEYDVNIVMRADLKEEYEYMKLFLSMKNSEILLEDEQLQKKLLQNQEK
jgi:hypothetical protein